ncbi:SDR family oxidoreductase [Rothia nasimurium]|uniref:SDR family oxidoreductase n=1 Tax=Luteibacter anthropi TaxID=564369 RepID=A0A7X5ZGM3_9GAMM|nr:SDR family oxidoreductase [Luteibacter anthropi]NII04893.1 SDR family oxidoreductase [Luteibacter anthropi]
MKLEGKTALVTGGSSGIGLATAALFAREGARVAITGRDAARLDEVAVTLGDAVIPIVADVCSHDDLNRMHHVLRDRLGGLDVFFANAGVAFGTPLESTTEARYDELMDINVKGVFFSMQAVSPLLREGASVILNTSWLNEVGTPGLSMLSASKAAVRSLARTWSAELLARRIRVNAVSPGAIDTPIHGSASDADVSAAKARIAQRVPLGRLGLADDIAQAALFLASDDSRYMLGAEIAVDGGFAQI